VTSITAEIEKAKRRVSSKKSIYADMIKSANEYINPEASLYLGEPKQNTEPRVQNTETAPAHIAPTVHETAAQTAPTAEPAPTNPAHPAPELITTPPETILPNQSKNVKITEFEIHPEKPSARATNPRRTNFGFTLNPIISVSRPKR
jgi:hypothetical protein